MHAEPVRSGLIRTLTLFFAHLCLDITNCSPSQDHFLQHNLNTQWIDGLVV